MSRTGHSHRLRDKALSAAAARAVQFGLMDRFIDLGTISSVFRRKIHDRVVDISIDYQHAIQRLFSPLSSQIDSAVHRTILYAKPARGNSITALAC
ncbi:MAG: hypothetical protein WB755_12835 [Terriglobales bacterium]